MKDWALLAFSDALDDIHKTHDVLHLCMQGLALLQKHPGIHELLLTTMEGQGEDAVDAAKRELVACKAMSESAKKEIDADYPTLHAQSVVGLWATLEALVEDLVSAWLENEPQARQSAEFRRIKVAVSEYESLDQPQRARYLVRELTRLLNADLKRGVGRFESLLAAVGLSGAVEDSAKRDLFELSQVRHVIVHRAGIADAVFCDNCPWYSVQVGAVITMSHDDYVKYYKAIHIYWHNLVNRVRVHHGQESVEWNVKEWEARGICGWFGGLAPFNQDHEAEESAGESLWRALCRLFRGVR